MIKTVLILSSATMLASLICTAPVFADDAPLCHDMPTHEKVLQEGKEYLHHEGDEHRAADFLLRAESIEIKAGDSPTILLRPLTSPAVDEITSVNIKNDIANGRLDRALERLENFGEGDSLHLGESLSMPSQLALMRAIRFEQRPVLSMLLAKAGVMSTS